MEEILGNIYNYIMDIINNSEVYGPLFACLLLCLESILPILPLFVFITIIFIAYGYGLGFVIAYLCTCLGCILSFWLCRTFLKEFFRKRIRKIKKLDKIMKNIDKMKLSSLVLLVAIPFTPAFVINIAAGLSEIDTKKFIVSILIGKISLIIFWGFIGTSLLESLQNPKIIIIILIMLLVAFLLSKFISKKLDIE